MAKQTKREQHREEWIGATEAARILTGNTDHDVSIDYVRMLARIGKITSRPDGRVNKYLKRDCENYHVRPQSTPRVRPRPSTRKQPVSQTTETSVSENGGSL